MNAFEWVNATTVDEALGQMGSTSLLKAGGVDVLDRLKEGLDAPKRLVNIRNIKGLDRIEGDAATGLRIGPLVTLAQLDVHPVVRQSFTALADAAGHAATPQIRNMATAGGNLLQRPRCWYFRSRDFHCLKKGGETCFAQKGENQYHAIFRNDVCAIVHPSALGTALVALGGSLELTGPRGKRVVRAEEFFTLPAVAVDRENSLGADEIVTLIVVPPLVSGSRSAYTKLGEKESFDWPIAEVAVVVERSGVNVSRASIVLGAAAPVPYRAVAAEKVLVGKPLDDASARTAAKAALEGATPLSGNGYKTTLFETVIRRTLLEAGGAK